MNPQELHEQKVKAKALLRRAENNLKKGLIQQDEYDKLHKHYVALSDYKPELIGTDAPSTEPKPTENDPKSLSPEVQAAIAQLTTEQNNIHAEKAKLCNELTAIPDDINCKDRVAQILELRKVWKTKRDEIFSVMATGVLPTAAPEFDVEGFRKGLPVDREKLRLRIQNLQSNIRKATKRLATAKTMANQRANEIKIARWTMEIDQMRMQLAAV